MRFDVPPMRPMDLDPSYVPYLESLLATRERPIHLDDPAQRRARMAALRRETAPPPGVVRSHHQIDAGDHAIPVRMYRPVRPDRPGRTPEPRRPGLLYLHGGGWMYGSAEQSEAIAARYCRELDAVVVSPDYRLTPEHPFPAGFDDCLTALRWLAATADAWQVDPGALAVAGESSGANLAAACALAVAADPLGPALRLQVLHYPALGIDFTTRSYRDNEHAPVLSAAEMRYFWDHYLTTDAARGDHRAVPLLATDAQLAAVAPAVLSAAAYDPLRDDAVAYAARLRQVGVAVELLEARRLPHGFLRAWSVSADVADIGAAVVAAGRRALHGETP